MTLPADQAADGGSGTAKPAVSNDADAPALLRQRAEAISAERPGPLSADDIGGLSPDDMRALLHELRVHQIELEMQNEELRQTQIELDASRAQYFDLYHLAPVGYCTVSENGLIVQANLVAAAHLGMPRGTLVRRALSEFIDDDHQDLFYGHRKHLLQTGEAQTFDLRMHRGDGTAFWAQMALAAAPGAGGTMLRVVLDDISERKLAEEDRQFLLTELDAHRHHLEDLVRSRTTELATARWQAEAANQAKSSFLADMSRELRTPMSAIIGLNQLMRLDGPTPEQAARMDKIDAAGRHLLAIVNDILDVSKIEAGRTQLDIADFHLPGVLDSVRALIGGELKRKGLNVEVTSAGVPDWLRGDVTRLRQALLNYANNAVKFTDAGWVRLSAEMLHDHGHAVDLRFAVEDSGMGIAASDASRLFQVFEQGNASNTRKNGGTGLGLNITRRLAQLMGGDAGLTSTPGEGSTFWFTARLERGEATEAPEEAAATVNAEMELRLHHRGARVLLAEDNEVNREIALAMLERVGLAVDTAVDGHEALTRAQASAYDLVLMDMQMPVMDGLDATRAIRALPGWATTPILALTANAFEEDHRACDAAGMSDFIVKPVGMQALYTSLLQWLQAGLAAAPQLLKTEGRAPLQPPL